MASKLEATNFPCEESIGRLDSLEDFVAKRGAAFYGLPPAQGTRCLVRETWTIPEHYPFGDQFLGEMTLTAR